MPYYSDNWTDKELNDLEKRIAEVFKQAEKDLDKEVKEYFAKFALRDKEMQQLVQTGDMTQAEYQRWRMTQIGRGKRFEELRNKVAERYTQANEVANAYVNDMTPSIYSLNRNYEAYTIEKAVGSCDFTMWDESTVRRLLVEQPDVMPYYPPSRALNRGIDLAYGKSQITKHVTSGIIRGLPPGKIANELMSSITTMNRTSAVRAARTGITAAQNAGRMDSYVAAEKMGIQIKRRWICTKDSRTRFDHGMADGQIVVGTKEPFDVGGYKMMFPGDSSMGAPGFQIYNCRCRTRTVEKDGIEAEPRQMRVRNPKWEEAKAEEDNLTAKVEKLKEREQKETDPEKRKQLRKERIDTQKELSAATKKRQGIDKNVVVNEMTYSDWKKWKETGKMPEPPKPVVKKPSFVPAKTKAEAEEYAKKFAQNVSYDGLSLKNANAINARLDDLFSKYGIKTLEAIEPSTKGAMSANHRHLTFNVKKMGKTLEECHKNFLLSQKERKESIEIIKERFKGRKIPPIQQKSIDNLESLLKFKRWGVQDSYDDKVFAVTTHEVGHIIADQFFGQINKERANPNYHYYSPLKRICDNVDSIYREALKNGDIHNISEYASKNSHEFFAECFTMYEYGEQLPNYIKEMVESVLKNGIM